MPESEKHWPHWLEELRQLADALEYGLPLPCPQEPKRPSLTLIRGGLCK